MPPLAGRWQTRQVLGLGVAGVPGDGVGTAVTTRGCGLGSAAGARGDDVDGMVGGADGLSASVGRSAKAAGIGSGGKAASGAVEGTGRASTGGPKSGEVLWQGAMKGAGTYGHGHAEPAKRYTRRTYSGGGCTPSSRRTHGLGTRPCIPLCPRSQ